MLKGAKSVVSLASYAGARAFRAPRVAFAAPAAARPLLPRWRAPSPALLRLYSGSTQSSRIVGGPAPVVDYKEVKEIVERNDSETVIIDTREPSEFDAGHIPHAVNIPFKSMPGALGLDSADFESTLGFEKPDPSKTLVFYCLGGVRSSGAEQLASTYGYNNRLNYKGSYEDWAKHSELEASTSGVEASKPQGKQE